MSRGRQHGFTIIESMLFLAISGLMVMGILAGAGVAINAQRYRDASNSLVSTIQSEYDRVVNVQNDRTLQVNCTGGTITETGADVTRGTTECVIAGRLLEVSENATLNSRTVYAAVVPAVNASLTDTAALRASGLFTSSVAEADTVYEPEWGTNIKLRDPALAKLLVVRSPTTGTIHTYTGSRTASISDMLNDTAKNDITFCLDPKGLVVFGWNGVLIT